MCPCARCMYRSIPQFIEPCRTCSVLDWNHYKKMPEKPIPIKLKISKPQDDRFSFSDMKVKS